MTAPARGTRCAGERRPCSALATVVRQGRPLCESCDERRRHSRNARGARKRKALHDSGRCDPERCYLCRVVERKAEGVEAVEAIVRRGPGRPALDGGRGESGVVRFRAPPSTVAKLDALVEDMGQDRSGVLRTLIDEEHARRGL